jgi:hypothetical protein
MRIISRRTLKEFLDRHPDAKHPLQAWYVDTKENHPIVCDKTGIVIDTLDIGRRFPYGMPLPVQLSGYGQIRR